MSPSCTLLSPALPSEFLSYVLDHHTYPTTLIICSPRSDFLSYLLDDVGGSSDPDPSLGLDEQQDDGPEVERPPAKSGGDDHIQVKHRLLRSPIYQIAVSRHIRTVYIPTATHLRAYLSVFSTNHSSKVVAAPPSSTRRFAGGPNNSSRKRLPHLLLYGFLDLHRDTSEWSAQGLGSSASALADLGHRLSWDVTVVEPLRKPGGYGTGTGTGSETRLLEQILKDTVPILSGGGRRFGLESGDGRWSGRTVEVGRVLMRWFRFQRGEWDGNRDTDDAGAAGEDQDTEMMGRPP